MDALDLDTPAVYVDLDALERNIARMAEQSRRWGVTLRPHTKTHKIPEIARMQLAAGAAGITVAKIGEAEVLPGDDVLIAYPIMPEKLPRLRALARDRRVTVVVDSVEAARGLPGVGAMVEVDIGVGRAGVTAPEQVVAVAPLIPATTEIRPGTYVFNDASCVASKLATVEDCALRVLVTVVSTAVPGQCLVDGGSKTFSSDATVNVGTFGLFPERPGWTMHKMNEEHGYVKIDAPAKIAEKVWAIPSHVCATVNMHDEISYGRRGKVDGTWKVAARGRVR